MMGRGTSRRSAVVADRRPLERGLARFLLEERGLSVVGEAATMADVLLQVQQLKPDIVVLHEKLALDHDPTVIAQIRRTSPRTSIVLLAANRESLPPGLILLADTVVEDGPGLTELGVALGGPPPAKDATTDVEATGVLGSAVASPKRRPGSRWADRLQGLAVASIIALAFVVARDMTTPSLVPTVVGRAHMVRAWDSLDELESALPIATTEQIAEIASVLIDERAAAEAGGVDLTSFDQALRERLASLWPRLPLETQALLVGLFQELIDDSDVLPLPSPSPSPNPSPEPTPPPSETTTPPPSETTPPPPSETTPPPPSETTTPPPSETTTPPPSETTPPPPSETTTPPPTETTTPPPSETTTPPPSETTTPPPTETQSESLVLIPFAFTLILAISGWARRRSHRSADGPD
jgi:cell division septation protein DedD